MPVLRVARRSELARDPAYDLLSFGGHHRPEPLIRPHATVGLLRNVWRELLA